VLREDTDFEEVYLDSTIECPSACGRCPRKRRAGSRSFSGGAE